MDCGLERISVDLFLVATSCDLALNSFGKFSLKSLNDSTLELHLTFQSQLRLMLRFVKVITVQVFKQSV